MVSAVSWIFLAGKFETLGGFMKPEKKINRNLLGITAVSKSGSGGRRGARSAERRPERRPSGPAGMPERF